MIDYSEVPYDDSLLTPERCIRCGTTDPCNCNTRPEIPTTVRERTMSEDAKARRRAWVAGR